MSTRTPVRRTQATSTLSSPQWSLGYRVTTAQSGQVRPASSTASDTYLRMMKERIMVKAGEEKNMAVQSPRGILRRGGAG